MKCAPAIAAAILLASATLATTAANAADCKPFGGIGNGVTESIAKFMAEAAVRNIIENKGLKPTGEIKHICTAAMVGSECSARQLGCK